MSDDLSRFRYHTGAALRRHPAGEAWPVLFRDLGAVAMASFLRGELRQLAGPTTPLLYMRTIDYHEPYIDYEDIGRVVLLRVDELGPWHSGVPEVYVARATAAVPSDAVGFAPPETTLFDVARRAAGVRHARDLREALGGRQHDALCADTLARLDVLNTEAARLEGFAEPLRAALQSLDPERRSAARAEMARLDLSEMDLCAAWHHLPRDRRAALRESLPRIEGSRLGRRP